MELLPTDTTIQCRWWWQGEVPKSGRVIALPTTDGKIAGTTVLEALEAGGVDLTRFSALCFDQELDGWVPVQRTAMLAPRKDRSTLDVRLEDTSCRSTMFSQQDAHEAGRYFGIGILAGKTASNQGTLWRSAYQLGAQFTFMIGARFNPSKVAHTDTYSSWQNVPLFNYESFEAFAAASPFGAQWVAVEMGGTPLASFQHPARAVYMLGAEDTGLPSSVLKACRYHVSLPSVRDASFNVAVTGSIIMYDRLAKQQALSPIPPSPPLQQRNSSQANRQNKSSVQYPHIKLPGSKLDCLIQHPQPLLAVRVHNRFNQLLIDYLQRAYDLRYYGAASNMMLFRCEHTAIDGTALKLSVDPIPSRAIEALFPARQWFSNTAQACAWLVSNTSLEAVLRLYVHPGSALQSVISQLPDSVALHPKTYSHAAYLLELSPSLTAVDVHTRGHVGDTLRKRIPTRSMEVVLRLGLNIHAGSTVLHVSKGDGGADELAWCTEHGARVVCVRLLAPGHSLEHTFSSHDTVCSVRCPITDLACTVQSTCMHICVCMLQLPGGRLEAAAILQELSTVLPPSALLVIQLQWDCTPRNTSAECADATWLREELSQLGLGIAEECGLFANGKQEKTFVVRCGVQ